jgi:putative nucleotidyltransferase-like protein
VSDRHESLALLAVLGERWDEAEALQRAKPVDPATFVALCKTADVAATVHAILSRAARSDLLGAGVTEELAKARAKIRVDNLLLLARLEQALDMLLAAGVRPVALKGVDVLHRLYRSFDERSLDDVDLLVPRDQTELAIATLERAGFTGPPEPERTHWFRSSFELPLTSPGPVGVAFEIHWSVGQAKRYRIDAAALIARAVPLDVAGRSILRLDEHDAVAHLLLHHVQHYFDRRLKWAIEVGLLARAPGFSWPGVAERLTTWGGRAAGALALLHVRRLFPEMLPAAAYDALPTATWRLLATLPLRATHPLEFYRGTRHRPVQLAIAAAALERPWELPGYLKHRALRDRRSAGDDP